MEAILITTENKKKKITINTFEDARQIVCNFDNNAMLEISILHDGTAILLDENGKLKDLAFNEIATQLAKEGRSIYPSDFIVGDVLIVDLDEFDSLPYE
jgi:hypothetical protein